MNISEITAHSVALSWGQSRGSQDGVAGFLVRLYKMNEEGIRNTSISNCTTTIDGGNSCRLENLQPSTNYSVTVASFKRCPRSDKLILGDESNAIDFTTGK